MVLSHALWQSRFGGDLDLVGGEVTLWGTYVYTVVGVMPPAFEDAVVDHLGRSEVWRPLAVHPERHFRDGRSYDGAVARLAAGVTLRQAQDDLDRIARELETEYPEENFERGLAVESLMAATVHDVKPALLMLSVAGALVLLIACANAANMLLARGASRRRELAVRTSLGASSWRLVRQLLTESLMLAAAAGALGLLLTAWTGELLVALTGGRLPRLAAIPIDAGLLAFTACAALATALIFGLIPALHLAGGSRLAALAEGYRSMSLPRKRAQSLLAVVELGLALSLLIAAGLLVKSLWQMLGVDPGFEAKGVMVVEVGTDNDKIRPLLERVRLLPGVEHAGVTSLLPLTDTYSCDGFIVDTRPAPPGQEDCAEFRVATPGFFEAMGIPLLRGRLFDTRDRAQSAPVVLIDQAMAKRYWPGEDPIGRRMTKTNGQEVSREIVGIVRSVRHFGLDREAVPQYFEPLAQQPWSISPTLVIKIKSDPAPLVAAIKAEIRALDAHAATSFIALEEVVAASVAEPRFRARVVGLFGLLAGILATVGVYGVMAYTVSQRTGEIGLRMALGARRGNVLWLILADGLRLSIVGVLCGLAGAAALGKLLARFLFQVTTFDPAIFVAMGLLLLAVTLVACYLPAFRASRVDPMMALRRE